MDEPKSPANEVYYNKLAILFKTEILSSRHLDRHGDRIIMLFHLPHLHQYINNQFLSTPTPLALLVSCFLIESARDVSLRPGPGNAVPFSWASTTWRKVRGARAAISLTIDTLFAYHEWPESIEPTPEEKE
jgi:hypothetical protein